MVVCLCVGSPFLLNGSNLNILLVDIVIHRNNSDYFEVLNYVRKDYLLI